MFLEKLELQGFKSFASKNKLAFSGMIKDKKRGITVVVGPNGSGKSNIADAVRWILGEQSFKTLRSKKSEDIIFSGSDQKARLNMAEASLFLNNEDSPQNDNGGDEIDAFLSMPKIVLTRRVFRDGKSEYYINNNKVRLSDIQMFLAKANFGQKTYSVIGQGMVENFLNTSPSEKKDFFDEATGVKQYQIKRDSSLNKLEASQENLSKVEMLLKEIEPRLNSLTRQVRKLKKRESLEKDLLEQQSNYYGQLWQSIEESLRALEKENKYLAEKASKESEGLNEKKEKLKKINESQIAGEDFYNLQEKYLSTKSKIEKIEKQIEKINSRNELERNKSKKEEKELLAVLKKEKIEISRKIENISEEEKSVFSEEGKLKKTEEDLLDLEKSIQEKKHELSKAEAWLEVRLEKQGNFDLSFLNQREQELKKKINESKNQTSLLEDSVKKDENKILEWKNLEKNIDDKVFNLEKEMDRVSEEDNPSNIKKINEGLEGLIAKIDEAGAFNEIEKIKDKIEDLKKEIKALINFSSGESYDYKMNSLKKEILELKKEKEKASRDFFDFKIQTELNKNKLDELRNLLLKSEKELLEVRDKIGLAETDDGFSENKKRKAEIEREIEELEEKSLKFKKEIVGLKLEKEEHNKKAYFQQSSLQKNQERLNELNNKVSSLEIETLKDLSRLEDLEAEIKEGSFSNLEKEESLFFERELEYVKSLKDQTEAEFRSLKKKIDSFNEEQEKKKNFFIKLQEETSEKEIVLNEIKNSLNINNIDLAKKETRLEDLEENILSEGLSLEKIKNHKVAEDFDSEMSQEEIRKIKKQLDLIGGIDPETEKEYEETKKRFDFLFQQTEDLNKTIKSLEKVIIELDSVIKEKFEAEFNVISRKFSEYFSILFNGGRAKIVPVKDDDGDDEVLENEAQSSRNIKKIKRFKKYNAIGLSGIDILATPPGKKISSINMLSGGERALTAIALICAIICANPSPFVVLDEVDASLDEANSERLAKILDDLSLKTQFIIISHNRATMKKANILYGVTMQKDGVSKMLSVKLDEKML
jgi:chromosome segregation protein